MSRFARDRRGAIAVFVALAAVPLVLGVAIAIEYGGASSAKSKLDLAADAAALSAVMTASNTYDADPGLTQASADGRSRFYAQAGAVPRVTVPAPTVTIIRNDGTFTATVSYATDYQTFLSGVVGAATMPLTGLSQATVTTGPYVDVQVLADNSSSMLIAAVEFLGDRSQLDAMVAASRARNYAYPQRGLVEWRVRIRLPLGQRQHATERLLSGVTRLQRQAAPGSGQGRGHRRVRHHRRPQHTQPIPLRALRFQQDRDATLPARGTRGRRAIPASLIGPTLGDPWHAYETNITESIAQFGRDWLTNAGNGVTADKPKKYVFLMTDGVQDIFAPGRASNRIESAVDHASCDQLKAKGAIVAVVHTLFYDGDGSLGEIAPIQASVISELQACASSPDLYIAVSDGAELKAAIKRLINVAIATPARFTK